MDFMELLCYLYAIIDMLATSYETWQIITSFLFRWFSFLLRYP